MLNVSDTYMQAIKTKRTHILYYSYAILCIAGVAFTFQNSPMHALATMPSTCDGAAKTACLVNNLLRPPWSIFIFLFYSLGDFRRSRERNGSFSRCISVCIYLHQNRALQCHRHFSLPARDLTHPLKTIVFIAIAFYIAVENDIGCNMVVKRLRFEYDCSSLLHIRNATVRSLHLDAVS